MTIRLDKEIILSCDALTIILYTLLDFDPGYKGATAAILHISSSFCTFTGNGLVSFKHLFGEAAFPSLTVYQMPLSSNEETFATFPFVSFF